MKFKKQQLFGKLEAMIMGVLWKRKCASVREVSYELSKKRNIAYTTVMTVMRRLCEKGILRRRRESSGAYRYMPKQTKESLLADASYQYAQYLINEFGEIGVAQFVDVLKKTDSKKIRKWKRQLKKIL